MADFQDIKLTANDHDLLIEDFDLVLISGVERVAQSLRIRMWFFLGEWFMNTSMGLDYLGELAVKNPPLTLLESTLKREILMVQDVLEILSFVLTFDKKLRHMDVTYQVNTTFGQTGILTT